MSAIRRDRFDSSFENDDARNQTIGDYSTLNKRDGAQYMSSKRGSRNLPKLRINNLSGQLGNLEGEDYKDEYEEQNTSLPLNVVYSSKKK